MSLKKTEEKFNLSIQTVFQKINESNSFTKGDQEILKSLIKESFNNEIKFNFILSILEENIKQNIQTKDQIKIIPLLIENNTRLKLYLNKVLCLLQSTIDDDYLKYSSNVADSFGAIVLNCWKMSNASDEEKKEIYEVLQTFCLFNINQESKEMQICGSLCLSRLIENCPLVLSKNYMKCIWDSILNYLEKKTYNAKSELLDSLISLIFAAESQFKTYTTVTLYKVLDFLTDNDWIKRKLAIDIVYTLSNYCPNEVFPLKSHIIEFLSVLKSDNVKQVREACNVTLKFLKDTEFEIKNEENFTNESEVSKKGIIENDINKPVNLLSKSVNNSFSGIIITQNREINNNDEKSNSKKQTKNNSTLDSKKIKFNIDKKPLSKERKKTTRNPVKGITNSSKFGYTIEENTEEQYLKTDHNISKRNSSYKHKSKTPKIHLMNELDTKPSINEKNIKNYTPIKVQKKTKIPSKTPERDSRVKEKINKTASKYSFNQSKIPKEIKRESSDSIFKGPVNQDFFNKALKDKDVIQILIKDKDSKLSSENYIENTESVHNTQNNNNDLSKSYKNRDFPLKIQCLSEPNVPREEYEETKINEKKQIVKTFDINEKNNVEVKIEPIIQSNYEDENMINTVKLEIDNKQQLEENNNVDLLKHIKIMSEKQLYLIDSLESLKSYTVENINLINKRLDQIEKFMMNSLEKQKPENPKNNVIITPKVQRNVKQMQSPKNMKIASNNINSMNSQIDTTWNEIVLNLKKNNVTEALILCNRNDSFLLKLIGTITINQLKDVSNYLLEETLKKILNLVSKHENTKQIILFIKQLLIGANLNLSQKLLKTMQEVLINPSITNKSTTSEEITALNLINLLIAEKLQMSSSHSPLIQSFANDHHNDSNYNTNASIRISSKINLN